MSPIEILTVALSLAQGLTVTLPPTSLLVAFGARRTELDRGAA